ncbi:MltR family transcriptional regulator [Massilia brevitalea]|uniref:MltR family transcriptional regulator n=1 Tax=Massilia brevitalea TaxID=442526 RepID=UPI0027388ED8|nr:MltR family transcriptional regulator [Massilia brevitalea]
MDAQIKQLREEFSQVLHGINSESDRGCALFAAAYLDKALAELLRSRMIQDKRLDEDIFSSQAPLGTFSSRIKLTYYMGMITVEERKGLDTVRSIRNHFAHHPDVAQFSDQMIRDKCLNLFPQEMAGGLNTPRLRFVGAIAFLLGKIQGSMLESKKANLG